MKKRIPEGAVAVFELTTGQSSVELVTDSKGMVKPSVKSYHRDPAEASRIAQTLFDELVIKYVETPREYAARAAA
jgi:hypothetical protein